LAGGNSKGVKLANHEDSPRITRGDHIENFMILKTGKSKDGSLLSGTTQGDQEEIPVGENLRGVMSGDHADSPRVTQGDHLEEHIKGNDDGSLGYFEIYIISPQLKEGLGVALIDTGSQVSLVKESSLTKFSKERYGNIQISGITGNHVDIKGQVNLKIENTLEPLTQICYVVDNLPRNLDVILGQDWLDNAGYGFQKKIPTIIPSYSEQVVKCKTNERGIRFIEHQILKPGLICASSLVNCEN
jgi:hypothetical protein